MKRFLKGLNMRQSGQAMTEMLVASAFVVVPLFLIIPTAGKYIDMKHAAVSSARYTAWERTVFFNDDTLADQPSNFKGFTASTGEKFPMKSNLQIAADAQLRIFTEADTPIQSGSTANRAFWTYHDGSPMYAPIDINERPTVNSYENTPDKTPGNATRVAIQAAGDVFAFVTGMFPDAISPQTFDPITTRGGTSTVVAMSVAEPPKYGTTIGDNSRAKVPLIDIGSTFKMRAKAGVLSQTWSAGGSEHLKIQAQALAPTKLIGDLFNAVELPIIGSGQNLIATALLTPEFSDENLVFGQMDVEVLPRDKFSKWELGDGYEAANPQCNEFGYCRE
jgi:hypothetical protein